MKLKLLRALLWLLSWFSLATIHRTGALIGALLWRFPNQLRTNTEINLALCYPTHSGAQRQHLARAHLAEAGKLVCEMAVLWRWPAARVDDLVVGCDGWEHLAAAQRHGRGTIVLSPHVGNWEIVGQYLSRRMPFTVMYRPPREAALEPFLLATRARAGAKVVPTSTRGIRALYQALAAGETIGMLPDQEPRFGAGVFAPFLGVQAYTMVLLSRLARKTRAPVLIVNCRRLPRGAGYHLHIEPVDEQIYDQDDGISAGAINRAVETMIALDPAQYMWNYKRFRREPGGARRRYRA